MMTQENTKSRGTLFIVATPIGNLEDISLRAIRILKEADLIAAEDTRHTRKLLSFYDIKTTLTSVHGHNEKEKSAFVISKIKEGKNIVYVTDAGTPCISDPGYFLISEAHKAGVNIVPIPGCSAVTAALSACGFPADRFVFYGFLPARGAKRKKQLDLLKNEDKVIVFYESPVRLLDLLNDLLDVFGDREMLLAREITKKFEEIKRGKVSEFIRQKKQEKIKGEITLVVNVRSLVRQHLSDEEIMDKLINIGRKNGISLRDAVQRISQEVGLPRKKVYQLGIELEKRQKSKVRDSND